MSINEIELLTFSIGGVKMAVDTAQIASMLKTGQAEEGGVRIRSLLEKIPFCSTEIDYRIPHVIVIKDEGEPYGVLIDRPEDIIRVSIDEIRPLPPVIASCSSSRAIWGAVLKGQDIILLIDFYRLVWN